MKIRLFISLFFFLICIQASSAEKRPLTIDDFPLFLDVKDPQCSSDGKWIAYTVNDSDLKADKRRSAVWMVNWDGNENLRLSYGESASSPRWSQDGKYLSFLSARPAESKTQVWLIDRRGGEPSQLTDVKEQIQDYVWSPDGNRLVLVMTETPDTKPKPIVMDRFKFKQDISGYLTAA